MVDGGVLLTGNAAKLKLCAWAQAQIGTHEGENNWNKYAAMQGIERLYGGRIQNAPWCDVFVDAAFISCFGLEKGAAMIYQRIGGGSALCRDSAQYFKDNGAFTARPEVGDVVFFYYDGDINHMGIVTRIDGGTVVTVEGNTSDMVAERCYGINDSRIAGYGRPDWALVADEHEDGAGNGGAIIMYGVDISVYQRGLTIQQLKDAGKSFAILKITEGCNLRDAAAFEFYSQAYESGFPVGGYCYSHAMNAEQAMAEGQFLLNTIKHFPFPCGLFLDMEEESQIGMPKEKLLDVIRGWCAAVGGAGYIPGIYSSEGTLWAKVSPEDLPDGCLVWVAKWSSNRPGIDCDVWQNSDSGRIGGYSGNVDTDTALSDRFAALVSRADYSTGPGQQEGDATDACQIDGECGSAGNTVDLLLAFLKTDEFESAFRRFVNNSR